MVCKVVLPGISITLVEPRLKRVSFLKLMVRRLGLDGVEIVSCRIDDEVQITSQTQFTHITGRAVTEVGLFLLLVERFAESRAQLVLMKGPKWRQELESASEILDSSSYKLDQVVECSLPFSGAQRALLIFSVKN